MVQVPVTCLQLGWDDDGVRPWQVEDGGITLGCYNVEDMHRHSPKGQGCPHYCRPDFSKHALGGDKSTKKPTVL